jgi:hypothetical protein
MFFRKADHGQPFKLAGGSGDPERLVGRSLVLARVCSAGHSPSKVAYWRGAAGCVGSPAEKPTATSSQNSQSIVIGLGC